jgi:hypothetical protein
VLEGLAHQIEAKLHRRPAVARELLDEPRIVGRLDDDQDVSEILPRGTDQAGPADVDLFDQRLERRLGIGRGLGERVKIHHDDIDELDSLAFEGRQVVPTMTAGEDAPVHGGMERLDPAVHHFGEAGYIGHADDRQALLLQHLSGAAGRYDFDVTGRQLACQRDQPGLVGNAQDRSHTTDLLDILDFDP